MKLSLGVAAAVATASTVQDSTVSKVIDLLTELKGKVEADVATEAAMMEEYSAWADNEKTVTSYSIKDEKRVINELTGTIEGESAKVEQFSSQIAELGPAIAGKQTELKDASALRKQENKDFLAKEAELVEAEDMLRRAHGVLKRALTNPTAAGGASLVQTNNGVKQVVQALSAIVSSAWIDPAKGQKLKAFLESDELSLTQSKQPQAGSYNYESKSMGIVQVIDDLREETVDNLRKARNAETSSRHAFELLSQSLDNEIRTMSSMLDQAQSNKAAAGEALGNAQGELQATEETLAADQAYLAQVTNDANVKSEQWASRQAQAAEELEVLESAKQTLSSGVKVFVQTAASRSRATGSDLRRDRVVALLKTLGHKFSSFGLLQAASSAGADPFEKVRGLLSDLLSKLQKEAEDEADHNEMCVRELAENEASKKKKQAALAKYTTRQDGAVAKTTTLNGQIAELEQEIKDLDKAVAEATAFRNKEHAENTKVAADNRDSAAATAEAIKILREYYGESAALVQQPAVTFGAAKSDATHGIIAILETAESDFAKVQMETDAAEEEAATAYKQFMQEAEVSKAKKETSIAGKQSEVQTLGVQLSQLKDDINNTETELEAVNATLDALHKDCDAKAMNYEERKQRRDAEIAGLQQALEILAADAESFIQKKAFLARA